MKSIIKNTWLILKNTKGFVASMTVWPIVMLLLLSVTLAYSNAHKIAVIDQSTDGSGKPIKQVLLQVEGFDHISVKEEDIPQKLLSGNIEMAVVLRNGGEADLFKAESGVQLEKVIKNLILAAKGEEKDPVTLEVNQVKKKGMTMSYSLGIMLFKFLTASSSLAALIIIDRNKGMMGRIFLSGISTFSYLFGRALVHFLVMGFTAAFYYAFCLIFNFDFGMEHSIYFLAMILLTNLFSTGVFTFMATFIKDDGALWGIVTFLFFPMALFSGALFPYANAPSWMQWIGSFMPQRWIVSSIEILQKQNSPRAALPNILALVFLSLFFVGIAAYRTTKLRVAK